MPIQAPQWTDYLNCPVCCREFGTPPRSPISLSCGHTICKHCLQHLHRRQCPFDQTVVNLDPEELVVNTALLQLAGVLPPAQPYHPPSVAALPEAERRAYDVIVRRIEDLALYLKYGGNATSNAVGGRLSRPMQRKLVSLVQCVITDEEGRGRAARAARSLGERTVTELILQHQNPQQLSANLWAAVRARGCQFLGPAMQEEVLKLVLLALEDGSALSRKVLVMFVVQRLEPTFPQASKTSIGHVVQLLYRASCFKVSKRQSDSSLMQLKEEFRTYESLRREHDAQIVQIATEAGLRIAPDQWSALLYGDTAHKSHMQSIIDKLQTPQSFAQSVQELFIALQRSGDPAQLVLMSAHLDRLAGIDATPDANSPSWSALGDALTSLLEVVSGLVHFLQQQASSRDANQNQRLAPDRVPDPANSQTSPSGSTPTHGKYKVSMCRDAAARAYCPRGNACTFAHSEEELERYRSHLVSSPGGAGSNGNLYMVPRLPQPLCPLPPVYPVYPMPPTTPNNFNLQMLPPQPIVTMPGEFNENTHEGMQNTNFPAQNMMNGQLANGMPINQNGLMPMMERPAFEPPVHPGLQYNNNMAPYSGLLTICPHPPSSQSYPFVAGYPGQVPAPGQKPPPPPGQSQVVQSQVITEFNAAHPVVMHAQVPVIQNIFVPIHPEMNNPSRDLSPYSFDELQSDLFSDSYRAVAASRYGRGHNSPPWPPAAEHAFNFDKLSGALPRVSTADDVFNVGERMAVGATSSSANIFSHPDDELEEEIQALERRLDKELDK